MDAGKFWYLTFENICDLHAEIVLETGEDAGIRDRNVIESAVSSVDQTFDGKEVYPEIFDKAATYAFQLAEGQGFINGNKRVGIVAALVFLDINDHTISSVFEDQLTQAMLDLASHKLDREGLSQLFRTLYTDTLLLALESE